MRYEVRWEDGIETVSSEHDSEEGAKKKARFMSKQFRLAIVAAIAPKTDGEGEEIVQKWTFEEGKQTDSHKEGDSPAEGKEVPEAAVAAPEGDGEVEAVEATAEPEGEATTKPKKEKTRKRKPTKPDTEPTAAAEVAANTSTEDIEELRMSPKAEKIIEQIETRKGSIKERMAKYLLANMGKQVTLAQLGRAAYGPNWKADMKTALMTAWGGLAATIKAKKIGVEAKKAKEDGKEVTFGIHAK